MIPSAPHVLVTGSSGAIGGAIVRSLSRAHPGGRWTLVDRHAAGSEQVAMGLDARVLTADLTRIDALDALVDDAESAHGPVDVLVNCAGIMAVRRCDAIAWSSAWPVLAVDLVAPLKLMERTMAGMRARKAGAVVNVASMAGRVPLRGCMHYGAAKAGLAMASEIARAELAPDGVAVLTVYPGPVASALEQGAKAQYGQRGLTRIIPTGDPDALADRITRALAAGRSRVVYPDLYAIGFAASEIARWIALRAGPVPVS